jgi:hypothetical protein
VLLGEQAGPVEAHGPSEAGAYTRLASLLAARKPELDAGLLEMLGPGLSQTPKGQLALAMQDTPRLARSALLQADDRTPLQRVETLQREVRPEEAHQKPVLTGWLVERLKEGTPLQSGASLLDMRDEPWLPGAIEGYIGQSGLEDPRKALSEFMVDELLQAPDARHQLLEMPDKPWLYGVIERFIQKGGLGPDRLTAADTCKNLDDLRFVLRSDAARDKPSGSLIGQREDKLIVGSVALRQRTRT